MTIVGRCPTSAYRGAGEEVSLRARGVRHGQIGLHKGRNEKGGGVRPDPLAKRCNQSESDGQLPGAGGALSDGAVPGLAMASRSMLPIRNRQPSIIDISDTSEGEFSNLRNSWAAARSTSSIFFTLASKSSRLGFVGPGPGRALGGVSNALIISLLSLVHGLGSSTSHKRVPSN